MFESTRRGQTFGGWNVDPVHIALPEQPVRVCAFRSYDLLGRRWSERHADFMNMDLLIPVRWRTIENIQYPDPPSIVDSQAQPNTHFRSRSLYRHNTKLVQFPIPAE